MNIHINTPEGTRDRRGYTEVITPEVEYYDLFVQSGNPIPQESMLKIIDRSGKIMVMRPDCTAPIARVAATKLKNLPLPQRLYYDQTVFRSGQANEGSSSEIAQCGVEMIGAVGEKADLEMVALAVDALRCCGVERFHIEVGHAGFYRTLAGRMNMPDSELERMRAAIEGKNYALLNDLLEQYWGQGACAALRRLPYLFGGVEVLDEAGRLAGACGSLDHLRRLYEELSAAGYGGFVRFDLGLVHRLDYYTGVVFRGYLEGAGATVLSGGRYDRLMEQFGRSAEATGFAVDVDAVGACLPVELPHLETVVHYGSGMLAQALAVVDSHPAGRCELSPCRTLDSTMNLAREKGAVQVLVLEDGAERRLTV